MGQLSHGIVRQVLRNVSRKYAARRRSRRSAYLIFVRDMHVLHVNVAVRHLRGAASTAISGGPEPCRGAELSGHGVEEVVRAGHQMTRAHQRGRADARAVWPLRLKLPDPAGRLGSAVRHPHPGIRRQYYAYLRRPARDIYLIGPRGLFAALTSLWIAHCQSSALTAGNNFSAPPPSAPPL